MKDWKRTDIPSQRGKIAVVTGPTSGTGFETALALAGAGARVVLAARDANKAAAATTRIRAVHPDADLQFEQIDLASQRSVASAAARIAAAHGQIDLLINNAGVMNIPDLHLTEDGFEMQFAANYLGHFALTTALLPRILAAPQPRIVNLSSGTHHMGQIDFGNLAGQRRYSGFGAYAQSKLAMLVFALELHRRAVASGWTLVATAAHPGWAATSLLTTGPGFGRARPRLSDRLGKLLTPVFAQDAAGGALPVLYAATAEGIVSGGYYGPTGTLEFKGPPGPARISPRALVPGLGEKLWTASERLIASRTPRLQLAS
jgi:NAD(P)-dependent dehydrogenase (short-subunit alcohol dehydrogenase family)